MKLRGACLPTWLLALLLAAPALCGCARTAPATASRVVSAQASFATPEEAVAALIAAGEGEDVNALRALLGRGTGALLSSGDQVADHNARAALLARYHTYHELVADGPNDLVLVVGQERWPFAIPLVRTDGRWFWDGAAGAPELLARRIGANEQRTVDVMKGFVAAQREYAAAGHDGAPPGVYAQKLRSTPGRQDGLYWEAAAGAPQSPAGALLAAATAEGYAVTGKGGTPYHGYLFRLLTAQGADAQGGARNYLHDGRLSGGFAALAYPDAYGASGVMTFMVNQDGVIWQRDLGKDTAAAVAAIRAFDPDSGWTARASEGAAPAARDANAPAPAAVSRRR